MRRDKVPFSENGRQSEQEGPGIFKKNCQGERTQVFTVQCEYCSLQILCLTCGYTADQNHCEIDTMVDQRATGSLQIYR